MGKVRAYAALLGGAALVVALDQWAKYTVRSTLDFGEFWTPVPALAPFLRIVHWNNTGAAFGLFPAGGQIFTLVAVVVTIAILIYYPRVPQTHFALRLALSLQLGGAIGNLIDRLTHGTVTDFIAVSRIPVFNVADASITVGVALLVLSMWQEERAEARRAAEPPELEESGPAGD